MNEPTGLPRLKSSSLYGWVKPLKEETQATRHGCRFPAARNDFAGDVGLHFNADAPQTPDPSTAKIPEE